MAVGGILEEKTVNKAKSGLRLLISMLPNQARILKNGNETLVPIAEVTAGDMLRVLPGETVPVDGEVVFGSTSADQSVMTGESLPVDKAPGDTMFCGTLNMFGSVDIKALKVGEDSSLHKRIRLTREAEEKKAPTQRVVDRWASWLVPATLAIALVTYLVTRDIERAVTVAIVFCPCALALATPTAVMAAIGRAAKHGVIIKSGEAIEQMGKADVLAFDKTGTLTSGKLQVSDIVPLDNAISEISLLSLAASVEARSEHPLGKAITACANARGAAVLPSDEFSMAPGKGARALVGGSEVICGNARYMAENDIELDKVNTETNSRLSGQGKACVLV
jgi:heavy metal translocating P-type ATPase